MPRAQAGKKNVTMWLDQEWVDRIDRLAKKADISRTRLMENVIKVTVEELETVDKVGIFTFAKIVHDLQEGIRAWAQGLVTEPE